MIYGLDLFSGIGGISLALSEWVKPIAYCEIDVYARRVLCSRMQNGDLQSAPIWDDVRTLRGRDLPYKPDIVYGGFPCQDISVAGLGKGLEGERSGLFFEIIRLVDEIRPQFIFLENVPAIVSRGLSTVTAEITKAGYDCRWTTLSASEVGANHKRERWWLLANADSHRGRPNSARYKLYPESEILQQPDGETCTNNIKTLCGNVPNTVCQRLERQRKELSRIKSALSDISDESWWTTEPDVGRVVNGVPCRVDRIKCLGNAVVPKCAKEAFKELMGLK